VLLTATETVRPILRRPTLKFNQTQNTSITRDCRHTMSNARPTWCK